MDSQVSNFAKALYANKPKPSGVGKMVGKKKAGPVAPGKKMKKFSKLGRGK